jgi:hypothetical protein
METKYKTQNLQPEFDFSFPERKIIDQRKIMRRSIALLKWLLENFDNQIKAKYYLDDIGTSCIRIFVDMDKEESNTLRLIAWLTKQKDWEREKFWREEKGTYSYRMQKTKNIHEYNVSYIILFEDTANIDGCVVIKKKVTKEIFVTDCEKRSVIFN